MLSMMECTVNLRAYVPFSLFAGLKAAAEQRRVSLSELVRDVLGAWLNDNAVARAAVEQHLGRSGRGEEGYRNAG